MKIFMALLINLFILKFTYAVDICGSLRQTICSHSGGLSIDSDSENKFGLSGCYCADKKALSKESIMRRYSENYKQEILLELGARLQIVGFLGENVGITSNENDDTMIRKSPLSVLTQYL